MQKTRLVVSSILIGLLVAGCNKDEASVDAGPAPAITSAPAKGGDTQAMSGEMTPGPGASEVESRVGSKMKDNR